MTRPYATREEVASPSTFTRRPCPLCEAERSDRVYARAMKIASRATPIEVRLEMCRECGILFQNPRPSPAWIREHVRGAYPPFRYAGHETGTGVTRDELLAARREFLERLSREPVHSAVQGRLLDVGCGEGDLLGALELPGWHLVGVEPDAGAAARARARGLNVTVGHLEDVALPAESFSIVSCVSILEHVADPRAFLRELDRLVTPGGFLFLEVPDSCRPVPQVAEFYSLEHLTHFTRGSLKRLLDDAGHEPVLFERPETPALRVGSRKRVFAAATNVELADDREELLSALLAYGEERARIEKELATRLLERGTRRIAIYGAGDHTRFLLDLIPFADSVTAILDSDPGKQGGRFRNWPIHAPEQLPELDVDLVVLSSRPYQEEMAARIQPIAQRCGIEVVRCYPPTLAA